jgi:hypothetical protein
MARNISIFKPLRGVFFEYNRCNGPEIFPVFDIIQPGLHVGMDGRGENRPASQRARAKFHPALVPGNNLVFGQNCSGFFGNVGQSFCKAS